MQGRGARVSRCRIKIDIQSLQVCKPLVVIDGYGAYYMSIRRPSQSRRHNLKKQKGPEIPGHSAFCTVHYEIDYVPVSQLA